MYSIYNYTFCLNGARDLLLLLITTPSNFLRDPSAICSAVARIFVFLIVIFIHTTAHTPSHAHFPHMFRVRAWCVEMRLNTIRIGTLEYYE